MGKQGNYDTMSLTEKWEKHLDLQTKYTDGSGDRNRVYNEIDLPFPSNPFSISSLNFTDISKISESLWHAGLY